ncbi:hypothetical protein ASF34_21420 [Methylobacterium sp. Leaf106]|nr:hypothetical protein ASF34_21420 [Methylobacterium sp. Leaf106]
MIDELAVTRVAFGEAPPSENRASGLMLRSAVYVPGVTVSFDGTLKPLSIMARVAAPTLSLAPVAARAAKSTAD